jgi:putative DNA primase/helicase
MAVIFKLQPNTGLKILSGNAIEPEAVRWLWPNWLACGKLHLLAGSPGTGKTSIALALGASVSNGGSWPDGAAVEVGDVLVWSGEEGIKDALLPIFMAAGGIRERVHFIYQATENGKMRPFDPAADMAKLTMEAKKFPNLKLLILDPIVAAVPGNSHKNAETRRQLQPVVDFAEKFDCAVLGITHLTKSSGSKEPLDRVAGSLAFAAVARGVIVAVKPADPELPRRLVRVKYNDGPDGGGLEYSMSAANLPDHGISVRRIAWGDVLEGSARELMEIEKRDKRGVLGDAIAFLSGILSDGQMPEKEVRARAEAAGLSSRTVDRAKHHLGVFSTKIGLKGWAWHLPASMTVEERQDA